MAGEVKEKKIMNNLQKKAWVDLFVMTVSLLVAGAGLGLIVRLNADSTICAGAG